jgi:hypothetical protein
VEPKVRGCRHRQPIGMPQTPHAIPPATR